jgi:hypothetical protein
VRVHVDQGFRKGGLGLFRWNQAAIEWADVAR